MHTFCLAATFSLSVAFEDPETHLELHGTVFNGKALRDYVEERCGKLEHRVIGITLFKYYDMRDVYGTTQMDACLNLVGRYLSQTFKKCLIFYYRKGRFVILGPKDMDIEAAEKEIESRFKSTWRTEKADIYLNIGLTSLELSNYEYSADTILSTMVRTLNEAGEKGGILQAEVARDEFEKTERETEIKRCLEKAIDKDKVEIFLQPIMDSKSGEPVGAEVLSRIRDEEGQIISPVSFISIAEKSGRIVELGEQILEKTCRFMKEWEPEKMGFKWINVNLSPVQLMRQDLADRFEAMVYKYDINPDLIHLEITEETLIDTEFMVRQTGALCDKGFNLVLDDYGTGYSNLSRLKRLPFINIKLDKSLVWDYVENSGLIIPNMINSFKNMGFSITAEGIEDEVMADKMREAGCDFLQGFLYSKPISVDEFIEKYS
jgi:EAL domain-containing protein (putative c-di-GMP-specific phosphodiesterase class I)